jgi:lipopolysaccharide export system permease protein
MLFFSNNIIPDFQRKAKNMLFIAQTKPAINFTPGQFIDQIPGYMVKFDKIYGENGENIEGVFVHKKPTLMKTNNLVAEKGNLYLQPTKIF